MTASVNTTAARARHIRQGSIYMQNRRNAIAAKKEELEALRACMKFQPTLHQLKKEKQLISEIKTMETALEQFKKPIPGSNRPITTEQIGAALVILEHIRYSRT